MHESTRSEFFILNHAPVCKNNPHDEIMIFLFITHVIFNQCMILSDITWQFNF